MWGQHTTFNIFSMHQRCIIHAASKLYFNKNASFWGSFGQIPKAFIFSSKYLILSNFRSNSKGYYLYFFLQNTPFWANFAQILKATTFIFSSKSCIFSGFPDSLNFYTVNFGFPESRIPGFPNVLHSKFWSPGFPDSRILLVSILKFRVDSRIPGFSYFEQNSFSDSRIPDSSKFYTVT